MVGGVKFVVFEELIVHATGLSCKGEKAQRFNEMSYLRFIDSFFEERGDLSRHQNRCIIGKLCQHHSGC